MVHIPLLLVLTFATPSISSSNGYYKVYNLPSWHATPSSILKGLVSSPFIEAIFVLQTQSRDIEFSIYLHPSIFILSIYKQSSSTSFPSVLSSLLLIFFSLLLSLFFSTLQSLFSLPEKASYYLFLYGLPALFSSSTNLHRKKFSYSS